MSFQFPIHWDCGCNNIKSILQLFNLIFVSVPYSLGLWLQRNFGPTSCRNEHRFQFPIHWDCGCNENPGMDQRCHLRVSVPYSLGLWLQQLLHTMTQRVEHSFSSLFIGIVAATYYTVDSQEYITYSMFQFPIHWDCGCN